MSENKPNVDEQEELDLSSMINEYEEDSDLRRKIESMKKEKELETVKKDVVDSAFIDVENTTDIPLFQNAKEENITADDSLGITRELNIHDADKTLVIMDNERAKVFNSIEADDEDESVFEYDNKEMNEEEITEADIQEFLGEDKRVQGKQTQSKDADKKNKIIMYCIIGCIALFVLVAVGFGVKVMFDDKKAVEPPKQEEPKDEPTKPVKPEDEPNEEPTPDNSIRIAEIKGIISGYEKNIATLSSSLTNAQRRYDDAKKQADTITSEISPIQTNLDNTLTPKLDKANKTYSDLVKRFNEGDTSVESEMNDAKDKYDDANEDWNDAVAIIQKLKNDKAPFDQAMKDANDEIYSLNTQINDINKEIASLQNELSTL